MKSARACCWSGDNVSEALIWLDFSISSCVKGRASFRATQTRIKSAVAHMDMSISANTPEDVADKLTSIMSIYMFCVALLGGGIMKGKTNSADENSSGRVGAPRQG